MILPQRKWHLYTWILLGILLPAAYILSWMVIPKDKIEVPPEIPEQFSVVHTSNNEGVVLEIHIKKPLAVPGLLVLLGEGNASDPESAIIIGQVHGMGLYKFKLTDLELASEPSHVLIYNPFDKTVTHRYPL